MKETETALAELLARDVTGKDIKVLMLDGEHMAGRCVIVALGITAGEEKFPVGLWDDATENETVVRSMLADLVSRGLSADDGLLVVIDGAKTLRAGMQEVFGDLAAVQRCPLAGQLDKAAGMLNAERSFRRIKGYKQMPQLIEAIHRHAHRQKASSTENVEAAASSSPQIATQVPRDSGHPPSSTPPRSSERRAQGVSR